MSRPRAFDPDVALEAAMEVFWTQGYRNTSVDDLLGAMGINRWSMYQTFGDKPQLFTRALALYRGRWAAFIEAHLAGASSPRAALMKLFRAQGNQAVSDKLGRGCLLASSAFEIKELPEDAARMVRDSIARLEDRLAHTITETQAGGEIDPRKDPRALARYLIASMNGIRGAARLAAHEGPRHARSAPGADLTDLVEIMLSALH